MVRFFEGDYYEVPVVGEEIAGYDTADELEQEIARLEKEMRAAAKQFEFEKAAVLRDQAAKMRKSLLALMETSGAAAS